MAAKIRIPPQSKRELLWDAITKWMKRLNEYPGWQAFVQRKVSKALHFDEPIDIPLENFNFDKKTEVEHAVFTN